MLDECGVCGGDGIAEGECDCDGNVLDECGICGGAGIAEGACDCDGNQLDVIGECGGSCLADFNGDGLCDWDTTSYWLSVETVTTHSGGELDGMTTYRVYMNMQNESDFMSSCSGDSENPLILASTTGEWYNNTYAQIWNAQGLNVVFFTFFPELAYDSFLTIGAEDSTTPGAQHPSTVWGAIVPTEEFVGGPGNNITVDDAIGGAWYVSFPGTVEPSSHVAFAGEDLRVLVAQFSTAGAISGQFSCQVFVNGDQGDEFRQVLAYSSENQPGQEE